MFFRRALLSSILLVCSLCAVAQRDTLTNPRLGLPSARDMFNSLSGSVVSMDNKPLDNVHVELRDMNGNVVSSTYTDSAGMFEFSEVRSGSYEILADLGVNEAREKIEVGGLPPAVVLRIPITSAAHDGNSKVSVSVAQYKVPEKARQALKKAREATVKGKDDEAQKQLAKALEIYPKYADALAFRAIFKLSTQDIPGATVDLQRAITDDENCALAYLVMGSLYNVEGKFDDAIRSLERGEALAPNTWQGHYELGKALLGKSQYENALRQLQRAESLLPQDFAPVHLAKARAMLGVNHYTDAMTELQAYLAKTPEGPGRQEAEKLMQLAKTSAARAGK